MPLFTIMEVVQGKKCHAKKEELAEEIAAKLLQECPGVSLINAATLRNYIFKLLEYNQHSTNIPRYTFPYEPCCGNSVTFPMAGTVHNLTVTCVQDDKVLKVCPSCKLTANIGDPLCPKCNHIYPAPEKEEVIVTAAVAALFDAAELNASNNQIILEDAVEGFRVTEGDVKKHLRDVSKYYPKM